MLPDKTMRYCPEHWAERKLQMKISKNKAARAASIKLAKN